MSERRITGIVFDDSSTQVTFSESHETSEKAVMFRMIIVQNQHIQVQLDELSECLHDLLEEALVACRNPPEFIGQD